MRPLLAIVLLALGIGCKTAARVDAAGAAPEKAVETFEAAWRIINETHFDTNFSGVNWAEARAKFLPRAQKARSDEELRAAIQEMLDLLGISHLMIIEGDRSERARREPGDPRGEGAPAFDFRAVENRLVITRVEPEAAALGLKAGMIVRTIDGEPAIERSSLKLKGTAEQRGFVQWHRARDLLRGPVGENVALLVDMGTAVKRISVPRIAPEGTISQIGNLPPMRTRVETRTLKSAAGKRVGYVWFNYWLLPLAGAFDRFVDEHRNADGIIIDLRGNVGGIGAMASGLAGHLVSERGTLGVMKLRDNELKFPVFPRRVDSKARATNTFQGKLALLVDPITLSTSELFAAGVQELGRARVFGETTGGQALPAIADVLPNGDLLYHAIADFTTPKGKRLEDAGVKPDEVVPLRIPALRAGRDEPLEAAMRWMDSPPQARPIRVD